MDAHNNTPRNQYPRVEVTVMDELDAVVIEWCMRERSIHSRGGHRQGQGGEGEGGTYHVCVCVGLIKS